VLFFFKFWTFCMNILCKSLKLGGTNYYFKWVKVSGTAHYWKAWLWTIFFKTAFYCSKMGFFSFYSIATIYSPILLIE
jgi:hypothetical protein